MAKAFDWSKVPPTPADQSMGVGPKPGSKHRAQALKMPAATEPPAPPEAMATRKSRPARKTVKRQPKRTTKPSTRRASVPATKSAIASARGDSGDDPADGAGTAAAQDVSVSAFPAVAPNDNAGDQPSLDDLLSDRRAADPDRAPGWLADLLGDKAANEAADRLSADELNWVQENIPAIARGNAGQRRHAVRNAKNLMRRAARGDDGLAHLREPQEQRQNAQRMQRSRAARQRVRERKSGQGDAGGTADKSQNQLRREAKERAFQERTGQKRQEREAARGREVGKAKPEPPHTRRPSRTRNGKRPRVRQMTDEDSEAP